MGNNIVHYLFLIIGAGLAVFPLKKNEFQNIFKNLYLI